MIFLIRFLVRCHFVSDFVSDFFLLFFDCKIFSIFEKACFRNIPPNTKTFQLKNIDIFHISA